MSSKFLPENGEIEVDDVKTLEDALKDADRVKVKANDELGSGMYVTATKKSIRSRLSSIQHVNGRIEVTDGVARLWVRELC